MSRRDWSLFLSDMREAIEKIERYTSAMTWEDFQADSRTVDAVVHNLLVIGEAARCLPADIKERRQDIDWIAITFCISLTGCPVVALPSGLDCDGLPIGVQLVGRPGSEARSPGPWEDCRACNR